MVAVAMKSIDVFNSPVCIHQHYGLVVHVGDGIAFCFRWVDIDRFLVAIGLVFEGSDEMFFLYCLQFRFWYERSEEAKADELNKVRF